MLDGDESLERHGSSAGRAAQMLDFHRSGKMRVLAVTSPSASSVRLRFRRRPKRASPAW